MTSTSKPHGFSLMELMITVAIVAILASIAYPSYRAQVQKSRVAAIQSELLTFAQYLERRYSETGCYDAGADAICNDDDRSYPTLTLSNETSDLYDITIGPDIPVDPSEDPTHSTFAIKATPKNQQAGTGALYIDHVSRRYWDENGDGDIDDAGENNWHRG